MATTTVAPYRADHWIAGRSSPAGERLQTIHDPSTGEIVGNVGLADIETVGRAVRAAAEAQRAWADVPVTRRAAVFPRLARLLDEHRDEMVGIIVREAGKTVEDARGELARAHEGIALACAAPELIKGEHSDQVADSVDSYSILAPNGVMVGITPFNFPLMLPLFMAAPAIATGNAFVLKPAEVNPSASNLLARLLAEAGVPPGIFSVVHGDRTTAEALIDHPEVAAVSFVGSTPVARAVYERASAQGKRAQALGGANNHMVVLPDADLDSAADALIASAFGAAGQRCMAVRTAVVVGDTAQIDAFEGIVVRKTTELRVGPGTDPASQLGPLISGAAQKRMLAQIDQGVRGGAALIVDGRELATADGYFVGPCIANEVGLDDDLYREEVFGPLLVMLRADDLDQAIELVGQTPYGNGAVIFTRDGGAARRFARSVPAGTVGVNVPIPVPVAWHGFGGWGDSRFGDHGLNADAYRFCTRPKTVTARWEPPAHESLNFQRR